MTKDVLTLRSVRDSAKRSTEGGFTIVEAIVGAAIMVIVMMGFFIMQQSQLNETRALKEKMAAIDSEQALIRGLSSGDKCWFNTGSYIETDLSTASPASPITVTNVAQPPIFPTSINPISPLPQSPTPANFRATSTSLAQVGSRAPSAIANNLIVSQIDLKVTSADDISKTAEAFWEVSFDSTRLVRALAPLRVNTTLTFTGNVTRATIVDCNGWYAKNFGGGLGIGWQEYEVPTNRNVATVYQNTRGNAIIVSVTARAPPGGCVGGPNAYVSTNAGGPWTWIAGDSSGCAGGVGGGISFTVPDGAYYQVLATGYKTPIPPLPHPIGSPAPGLQWSEFH